MSKPDQTRVSSSSSSSSSLLTIKGKKENKEKADPFYMCEESSGIRVHE